MRWLSSLRSERLSGTIRLRPPRRGTAFALERALLYLWLLLLFTAVASDVVRVPYDVSFASDALWSSAARPGRTDPATGRLIATPIPTPTALPSSAPSPTPVLTSAPTATPAGYPGLWHIVASGDVLGALAARYDVTEQAIMEANGLSNPDLIRVDEPLWIPIDGAPRPNQVASSPESEPSPDAASASPVPSPGPTGQSTLSATATPVPTETPVPRYLRGGIAFDAPEPLTLAYPVSFDSDQWVRFRDLDVLMADQWGENYRRFITEYDHQLYAYPETLSGTFVLSIHDGTLSSGRELEAEPLRQLIEGPLHSTYDLDTIQENLDRLLGTEFAFERAGKVARFEVVQALRMSANDVAEYQYRAMELSLTMDPIASPGTSLLVLFCSGRQPDEPRRPFPGRYVLVLEEIESAPMSSGNGSGSSPQ